MSYLDHSSDSHRRGIGLAGTAAIQGLIAYVVLTGLAVHFVPRAAQPPTAGSEIRVALPPPPPAPTPRPKQALAPKRLVAPPMPFPLPPLPVPTASPFTPAPTPLPLPTYAPPIQPTPTVAFKAKPALPKGDPATWVNDSDYPPLDENEAHEGTTVFRVTVGTDGRVSSCTVVRSSGHAGLDAAACKAVRARARFVPAIGDDGEAVAGSYTNSVRWQLPR